MNYIDLFLLLVILVAVIAGYRRGFITGALNLLSWIVTLGATFFLYPYVAHFLDAHVVRQGTWTLPLAFLMTLGATGLLVSLVVHRLIYAVPIEVHESYPNKLLGIIPGFFNGLVWVALLGTLLLVLPLADGLSEGARHSRLATALTDPVSKVENSLSPLWHKPVRSLMTSLTTGSEVEGMVKLPFTVASPDVQPDLEREMLVLVNKERAQAGLPPLEEDSALTRVARQHSRDMFAHGYFAHDTPAGKTPFQRMESAGIHYVEAGENIALAPTLMMAHEGLMHSPGHRANILRRGFARVGIGILDGGKYGLMVTQDFAR